MFTLIKIPKKEYHVYPKDSILYKNKKFFLASKAPRRCYAVDVLCFHDDKEVLENIKQNLHNDQPRIKLETIKLERSNASKRKVSDNVRFKTCSESLAITPKILRDKSVNVIIRKINDVYTIKNNTQTRSKYSTPNTSRNSFHDQFMSFVNNGSEISPIKDCSSSIDAKNEILSIRKESNVLDQKFHEKTSQLLTDCEKINTIIDTCTTKLSSNGTTVVNMEPLKRKDTSNLLPPDELSSQPSIKNISNNFTSECHNREIFHPLKMPIDLEERIAGICDTEFILMKSESANDKSSTIIEESTDCASSPELAKNKFSTIIDESTDYPTSIEEYRQESNYTDDKSFTIESAQSAGYDAILGTEITDRHVILMEIKNQNCEDDNFQVKKGFPEKNLSTVDITVKKVPIVQQNLSLNSNNDLSQIMNTSMNKHNSQELVLEKLSHSIDQIIDDLVPPVNSSADTNLPNDWINDITYTEEQLQNDLESEQEVHLNDRVMNLEEYRKKFLETKFLELPEDQEAGFDELEKSYHSNVLKSSDNNINVIVTTGHFNRTPDCNTTSSFTNRSNNVEDENNVTDPDYEPHPETSTDVVDDTNISITNAKEAINDATFISTKENNHKQLVALVEKNRLNTHGNPIITTKPTWVKSSQDGSKQHACYYCKKLVCKLPRHLLSMHRNEEKIIRILNIKKKDPMREVLFDELRCLGDFIHNRFNSDPDRELIVARRPSGDKMKDTQHWEFCAWCGALYGRNSLRMHYKNCSGRDGKKHREMKNLGRILADNFHPEASKQLRHILSKLTDDEVGRIIRYDHLIIRYGNWLAEKYIHERNFAMIRNRLRPLARLLIAIRAIDGKINMLSMVIVPENFKLFIEGVNIVAGRTEDRIKFCTPAVASGLGTLIEQVCAVEEFSFIESGEEKKKNRLNDFLKLKKLQWNTLISKTVSENQNDDRRQKKNILPSTNDIEKLMKHVENLRDSAYDDLTIEFSNNTWLLLAETTLVTILIFNRRRVGELQQIVIEDYKQHQKIDINSQPDLFVMLSDEDKQKCENYVRFEARGKLGRNITVLLDTRMHECIQMILKYRNEAGVHEKNPYVFASPGDISYKSYCLDLCSLVRKYRVQCGANMPENLRGTNMRKHLASNLDTFNTENVNREVVANHLGHHLNIHNKYYRMPNAGIDIVNMTPVLEKACRKSTFQNTGQVNIPDVDDDNSVNSLSNFPSTSADRRTCFQTTAEVHFEAENETSDKEWNLEYVHAGTPIDHDKNSSSDDDYTISKPKPPKKPSLKRKLLVPINNAGFKRVRWSLEENKKMHEMFSSFINDRSYPSLQQLDKACRENVMFQKSGRDSKKMKTWFANLYKKK